MVMADTGSVELERRRAQRWFVTEMHSSLLEVVNEVQLTSQLPLGPNATTNDTAA